MIGGELTFTATRQAGARRYLGTVVWGKTITSSDCRGKDESHAGSVAIEQLVREGSQFPSRGSGGAYWTMKTAFQTRTTVAMLARSALCLV